MSWTSKSAAILGLAATVAAVHLAITGLSNGSVAFAQVIDKLRSAETLTFDSVIKSVNDGKVINKSRHLYMVPGKVRNEIQDAKDGSGYVVFNIPAGKALIVDSKRKTARVSPLRGGEGNDMAAETIEYIRSLRTDDARPVGERLINGVRAKGFEIVREKKITTVWAAVANGDPIRIEILENDYPSGPILIEWTNIKPGEKLDPALFSVDPPPGFTVIPFLPIDFEASPATYVVGFLKIYAKHMEGQFPPRLQDAIKTLGEKLEPPKSDEPLSDELSQLPFYSAATVAITRHGKQGEDWQYYPGHTLGDKKQIVFWCRDKKRKEYSVVYADLRVEQVEKNQLPPAPVQQEPTQ